MAVELTRKSFTPYAAKKGEDYMNARQRTHFRKILEALKAELSEEIDRTVHTMQDEATVFADPNARASQESDMALELRNRDRERKLIKKIDETIARIDANEYGYCDSCGGAPGLHRPPERGAEPAGAASRRGRPQRCASTARRSTSCASARSPSKNPLAVLLRGLA